MKFIFSTILLFSALNSFAHDFRCYDEQLEIYDQIEDILFQGANNKLKIEPMVNMVKKQMLHDKKCGSYSILKEKEYLLIIEGLRSGNITPGAASAHIELLSKRHASY